MAATRSRHLEVGNSGSAVGSKPPVQRTKPSYSGFQYRGTLFRPSSAHTCEQPVCIKPTMTHDSDLSVAALKIGANPQQSPKCDLPPRRIQSAKGRLERQRKDSVSSAFSQQSSYSTRTETISEDTVSQISIDKKPSVVHLNVTLDCPDKEEELLEKRFQKNYKNDQNTGLKPKMRPFSATDKSSHNMQTTEEGKQVKEESEIGLKPNVYGMKRGRHVSSSDPEVLEAWVKTGQDFPFKLSQTDVEMSVDMLPAATRKMPSTLASLQPYLRNNVSSDVIGIDPSQCLVFLADSYTTDELPEVPNPQKSSDNLPYTCVVVSPRKVVQQKYHHPFFDRPPSEPQYECKHTSFVPKDDISFLLHVVLVVIDSDKLSHPPVKRNPHEIRQEIRELEDLLYGIGSLQSNCSVVQFQAEIRRAKFLARKLIITSKNCDEQEPKDTFGLLKLLQDHDEVMKAIQERRESCLKELAEVEAGL